MMQGRRHRAPKTPDELNALLLDLRKEQFNLRFQRATGQQEGISRVRVVRRKIARVKTIHGEQTQPTRRRLARPVEGEGRCRSAS